MKIFRGLSADGPAKIYCFPYAVCSMRAAQLVDLSENSQSYENTTVLMDCFIQISQV